MKKAGKPDPMKFIIAKNGVFIEEGHHRYLAARLVGAEIPLDPRVITVNTMYLEFDWPGGLEWTAIDWDGF